MTATPGADRPVRLGGKATLTLLIRANDDVTDCVLSRAEGGAKLDEGLADRIRAHTEGSVTADVRHGPAGPAEQMLAELGADALQLSEADVLVVSIEPDVTARRSGTDVTTRFLSAMAELAQLAKENDAHLIVFNGSTLDPDDTTSCFRDVAEPPSLVIHRLNLALMQLSVLDGLSIIDVDRVIAEIGGQRSLERLLSYAPQACDAICDEVVRVLDDYGFFESRPLLAQVGRRSR
jgi:hypothetical protein